MYALHEIEDIVILNTVTRFGVSFYGTHEDIHNPKNKIEVRVILIMMTGEGRKSMNEEFNRMQFESVDENSIECIFDPETKILTPKKKNKILNIANLRSVTIAVDTVVKEALVNQKFGNLIYED